MPETLIAKFMDYGITIAGAAVVIWWLQKTLASFIQKWEDERSKRVDLIQGEMGIMRGDIVELRKENKECQADRIKIHQELISMYRNNPTLKQ